MGIPTYFKHVFFTHTDILSGSIDKIVDNFYMDLNCLIYPCSKNKDTNEEVISNIIKYIDTIINNVNPQKKVFIAIDGVCPLAKIITQKKRRLKSSYDKPVIDEMYKKFNVDIPKWDTINISPGTVFMKELSNAIYKYIEISEYIITFSDSDNYEEGEQKIIKDIRKNSDTEVNCIYGLDSDLIMLSLIEKSEIFLYREKIEFGSYYSVDYDSYVYLSIGALKNSIFESINENDRFDKERLIKDYVFISFFIGNDFIPQLPSLKIRNKGYNIIIETYKSVFLELNEYLVKDEKNGIINNRFLYDFLYKLSLIEPNLLCNIHTNYVNTPSMKVNMSERTLENEIKKNMIVNKNDVNCFINFKKNGYKKRYYKHYFDIDKDESLDEYFKELNKVCYNYFESLKWTLMYYFNEKIPSYEYYYKYNIGPFIIDIFNYLKYNKSVIDKIRFNKGIQLTPQQHLALILPKDKLYLIEKKYKLIIDQNFSDYYDSNIIIDYQYKLFKHEGIVMRNNTKILDILKLFRTIC